MIYATADPHVFHKNIIEYDQLPFSDLKTYREYFIYVWNETISYDDETYLLGDVAAGGSNSQIKEFLLRLNGKKYLILGNHDYRTIMKCSYLRDQFEWIKYYYSFDYQKQRFILFHYPIESWANMMAMKSIHLHGHSHGRSKEVNRRLDVGFKACGYKILSIDQIIKELI